VSGRMTPISPLPAAATDFRPAIAEKVLLNELVLMLTGAAGALDVAVAGADDVVAGGVVPPEELLPHAAAANPTATSATVIARLWVKGKVSSSG
jgi:hypothetical protein